MSSVTTTASVDAATLTAVIAPRDGLVAEVLAPPAAAGEGGAAGEQPPREGRLVFVQSEGPLRHYRRTVVVEAQGASRWSVTQQVDFKVGLPWFSWLFVIPIRSALRRLDSVQPWWAPPQRVDRRGAVVLATLCALAVVVGYLSTVIIQTMTYVGAQYHIGTTGQGIALGVVQFGAVLALGALVAADRRGRRELIVACAWSGLGLTAAGALAPGLGWLTAVELLASALVGALYLLVFVVASEEMPQGSRAWAAGVLSLCYGLGSGGVLLALPLAGLGANGWRWVFVVALAGAPVIAVCAGTLPESRRFQRPPPGGLMEQFSIRSMSPEHRRRLLVLGAASLAYALFATPASQFSNQFLRVERHFSAVRISVIEQVAGTIGGLGVLVGGRLADTRGRRPIAAAGVAAGTAATLASFFAHGWVLWAWTIAGSMLAYAVVPALAVYGPELFPTRSRSAASGLITVLGAAGGVAGLVITGVVSSLVGTIGPALGVVALGPLVMVVLVVVAFPETAHRSLEELNVDLGPQLRGARARGRSPGHRPPRESSESSL